METRTRLALFAAALAVVFGLGWGLGAAVGPFGEAGPDLPAVPTGVDVTAPLEDPTSSTAHPADHHTGARP